MVLVIDNIIQKRPKFYNHQMLSQYTIKWSHFYQTNKTDRNDNTDVDFITASVETITKMRNLTTHDTFFFTVGIVCSNYNCMFKLFHHETSNNSGSTENMNNCVWIYSIVIIRPLWHWHHVDHWQQYTFYIDDNIINDRIYSNNIKEGLTPIASLTTLTEVRAMFIFKVKHYSRGIPIQILKSTMLVKE